MVRGTRHPVQSFNPCKGLPSRKMREVFRGRSRRASIQP